MSQMATKQQLFEYLDEHLPYTLKQLRHSQRKINQEQHYLDWNSFFQSFAVNARNLVDFLVDKDARNMRARDFIPNYIVRKGDLAGRMNTLDQQVFHLAKVRPREPIGKIDTGAAGVVFEWIEEEMMDFLAALPSELRQQWNADKADPDKYPPGPPTTGPTGPGLAPSASSSVTASTTTLSTIPFAEAEKPVREWKPKEER
jgi:hypothetical protein